MADDSNTFSMNLDPVELALLKDLADQAGVYAEVLASRLVSSAITQLADKFACEP